MSSPQTYFVDVLAQVSIADGVEPTTAPLGNHSQRGTPVLLRFNVTATSQANAAAAVVAALGTITGS
ncbi:MAG TPA: hypothetical protein VGI39_22435 [Polyangiaceae bacterium]|jgi:hypothetical protein